MPKETLHNWLCGRSAPLCGVRSGRSASPRSTFAALTSAYAETAFSLPRLTSCDVSRLALRAALNPARRDMQSLLELV